jgi:hypothetical protein
VGHARGCGFYAGEDTAEALDERASEVGCRRPLVEVRERAVKVIFPATTRWR